jgi:hypothetical protein
MPDPLFRKIRNFELRPAYISLGLPSTAFRAGQATAHRQGFSAALNGPGDILWLFKGSDYYTFNLRTKKMQSGPDPIERNWAGGRLPEAFKSGVDAAAWAGEDFPKSYYLFKGSQYVRLNASRAQGLSAVALASRRFEQLLFVDEGPEEIGGTWACTASECFLSQSPTAALHGVRAHRATIHFFDGADYLRHNLLDGFLVDGPASIAERWTLPASFPASVDLAFYGAGEEEDHLFLVAGNQCARFDTRVGALMRIESVDKSFPDLALHLPRPQLFLVEDYVLETHVASVVKGQFVKSVITEPRSSTTTVLITEITTKASTALRQNLLQSEDQATTSNFYQQMDDKVDESAGSESYRYRMQALFHGEAAAKGLWGGEVDANLDVQGGSDLQRANFAKSAFQTVSSQVSASTHTVNFRAMTQEDAQEFTGTVFDSVVKVFNNLASDRTLETQIFAVVEPYVALLMLKNVRAAFTDGMTPPQTFSLTELPRRLPEILVDGSEAQIAQLLAYIKRELSSIESATGERLSVLDPNDSSGLRINSQLRFRYPVDMTAGQTIDTRGIAKSARESLEPTYGMTVEDRHLA